MYYELKEAKYIDGYKIRLKFNDGSVGEVDFSGYSKKKGVFKKFGDIEYLKSFKLDEELGTLVWGGEIDMAPETLYNEATKKGLPDWMEGVKSR